MKKRQFNFNLAPKNHAILLGWLIMHAVWFPLLGSELMRRYPESLGVLEYNVIFYTISTAVVLIFGWKYLRADFDVLIDNGFLTIVMLIRAFLINIALSFFAAQLIVIVSGGDMSWLTSPDESVATQLTVQESYKLTAMTTLLAPVIDEVLFRGAVFGWLRKKDRLAAYIVSMLLYAIANVWQYAIRVQDISVLMYMISYLPMGYITAWCYDQTGSIWTGILFGMGTNLYGFSILF